MVRKGVLNNLSKLDFWEFFQSVKPFIKFSYYLDIIHLSHSSFSKFMKKDFSAVGLGSLNIVYDLIIDDFKTSLKRFN